MMVIGQKNKAASGGGAIVKNNGLKNRNGISFKHFEQQNEDG
jgi:hypothetical protein